MLSKGYMTHKKSFLTKVSLCTMIEQQLSSLFLLECSQRIVQPWLSSTIDLFMEEATIPSRIMTAGFSYSEMVTLYSYNVTIRRRKKPRGGKSFSRAITSSSMSCLKVTIVGTTVPSTVVPISESSTGNQARTKQMTSIIFHGTASVQHGSLLQRCNRQSTKAKMPRR